MSDIAPPQRRTEHSGAQVEYQRQVRRFFRFLRIVLVLILLVVVATAWYVRGAARSAANSAREAKLSADAAENASKVNTGLLDRYKPCLADDDADSPQCQRAKAISDAIAAIQAQHAAQDIKVREALAKLESLLARPAVQRATAPQAAPVTRTAPRATSGAPAAPATTTATTAAPPTPTTVCPERGKRPKECR